MSLGARGMSYYLLHELSHNISEFKTYENEECPRFLTNNNFTNYDYQHGKLTESNRIEIVTNTAAFSLAATLGIAMDFDPPHGTF